MKIVSLIDNLCNTPGLQAEHGLSLYIETAHHKILADTGYSGVFADNAKKMGIDLQAVDTVFLSHGHYDHCNGILEFAKINKEAVIYLNTEAYGDYWSISDKEKRYIGIDKSIQKLKNVILLSGNKRVDSEIFIFGNVKGDILLPITNNELMKKLGDKYINEDFDHEQYLVVEESGKKVLISGCAHKGIINILRTYRNLYGNDPDVVISGFHTMNSEGYSKLEIDHIKSLGEELSKYRDTQFYTCHCTGYKPFEILQDIMGEQLQYIATGDILQI